MNWTDARAFCQATAPYNGDLASVPDQATNDFLTTLTTERVLIGHNVAKRPFGISISERLYLFSRTPSGAPNGSPALTYKWTTQLLKEIAPPWPLDLSEGHGGGPGVVGDEQH